MFFYKRGEMTAETLEVYRICARLDSEDPLPIIRDRGVGKDWLKRMGFGEAALRQVTAELEAAMIEVRFRRAEPDAQSALRRPVPAA